MSNVHGWTALAGAVVALAGGAATAQAAPQARAGPVQPALATGRAADGAAFSLNGKRLTVTLPRKLAPKSGQRLSLTAICGTRFGDTLRSEWPVYQIAAARVRRDLRVPAGVRRLRVGFGADVARWADLCTVSWRDGDRHRLGGTFAQLRLRRGTPPGCTLVPGTRVDAESDDVLVLAARYSSF